MVKTLNFVLLWTHNIICYTVITSVKKKWLQMRTNKKSLGHSIYMDCIQGLYKDIFEC